VFRRRLCLDPRRAADRRARERGSWSAARRILILLILLPCFPSACMQVRSTRFKMGDGGPLFRDYPLWQSVPRPLGRPMTGFLLLRSSCSFGHRGEWNNLTRYLYSLFVLDTSSVSCSLRASKLITFLQSLSFWFQTNAKICCGTESHSPSRRRPASHVPMFRGEISGKIAFLTSSVMRFARVLSCHQVSWSSPGRLFLLIHSW